MSIINYGTKLTLSKTQNKSQFMNTDLVQNYFSDAQNKSLVMTFNMILNYLSMTQNKPQFVATNNS